MRFDILTLFPQMCKAVMEESIIGRAVANKFLEVHCHLIRDYTYDKHNRVDDTIYGGGMGMLLMAEPLASCFEHVCRQVKTRPHLIFPSPKGKVLTQERIKELGKLQNIAIVCGHYEGVDQRFIDEFVDEQISIGDYVVTGGELPALVIMDSVSRMVKGVLSDDECFEEESHYNGLLEYPQYTKPAVWRNREVPEVLRSGNHTLIEKFRHEQAVLDTAKIRPDMLDRFELTREDIELLKSQNLY